MAYQPEHPGLRASDAEREVAVERLRIAATEGRLDPDELDERLSAAYAAKHVGELRELVRDVTPPPSRHTTPAAAPARPVFVREQRDTNRLAVGSLAFGLMPFLWGFGPIVAIVLGHVALGQIRRTNQRGRTMAIVGTGLGYLALVVTILVFVLAATVDFVAVDVE